MSNHVARAIKTDGKRCRHLLYNSNSVISNSQQSFLSVTCFGICSHVLASLTAKNLTQPSTQNNFKTFFSFYHLFSAGFDPSEKLLIPTSPNAITGAFIEVKILSFQKQKMPHEFPYRCRIFSFLLTLTFFQSVFLLLDHRLMLLKISQA